MMVAGFGQNKNRVPAGALNECRTLYVSTKQEISGGKGFHPH
jgi:hypothetical protein